ncbi:hypothetical protein RN001_014236 [Aquatica leii]|uniref:E3 SUMO-protein ligase NSE2 n=1 Tax=Aquatica leii TaxID=1421715 RepID=A0AAN7S7D9_9COLE|nr:hypothetical protein RN001_014236 [Aquatica leii]
MANLNITKHDDLLKNCIKELHNCLEYVHKYSDNVEEQTNIIKTIAKDYCEIDAEHKRIRNAQEATDQYFQNQDEYTDDVQTIFKKHLEEQPVDTYENHPIWRKINVLENSSEECDDTETSEVSEDEDMFEEGILPTQFEPPIDPITKKAIEDPCKNRKCGHVYEYNTIVDHLNKVKTSNVKPRCPYIGCANKNMNIKLIIKDSVLKQQIVMYNSTRANKSDENVNMTEIL